MLQPATLHINRHRPPRRPDLAPPPTGLISGTPTATATRNVTVTANGAGGTGDRSIVLPVHHEHVCGAVAVDQKFAIGQMANGDWEEVPQSHPMLAPGLQKDGALHLS